MSIINERGIPLIPVMARPVRRVRRLELAEAFDEEEHRGPLTDLYAARYDVLRTALPRWPSDLAEERLEVDDVEIAHAHPAEPALVAITLTDEEFDAKLVLVLIGVA